MQESNRIELKRELTESLKKGVVVFLNYRDGGVIYIGVDDKPKSPKQRYIATKQEKSV